MRILGADSFVGRSTSINAIPVNVLKHHDICITKIEPESIDYIPAVYFFEYITGDMGVEDIPYIITPLDNLVGDDGGRWKIKDIFVNRVYANSLHINTILSKFPGVPINIGDSFTVSSDGITVDGRVIINSALNESPLVVNSSIMVENLNSEFIGGESADNFLKNYNFDTTIPNGVTEFDVYFTHNVISPPHYTVFVDICNIIDINPSIYSYVITRKELGYFTIRFSGVIDSANYTLHYLVVGNMSGSYIPPVIQHPGNAGVLWEIINTNTTAIAGYGYFVDTEAHSINLTLPSSPNIGDRVDISDYFKNFTTNNCTVIGNGRKIMGLMEDFICDIGGLSITMIYSGLAYGWRVAELVVGDISGIYVSPVITPVIPPASPHPGNAGVLWGTIAMDTTAIAGYGYFVDTEARRINLTLPGSPNIGDRVRVVDYFKSFNVNNCTIVCNDRRIMGLMEDFVCDVSGINMVMIYSGFTYGWKITELVVDDISGSYIPSITPPVIPPASPHPGNAGVLWGTIAMDTTAIAGYGYFVDTEARRINLTLPGSPNIGDRVEIVDYSKNFTINNCIIINNNKKIMGLSENFICNVSGINMVMIYSGLTYGWRVVSYNIR